MNKHIFKSPKAKGDERGASKDIGATFIKVITVRGANSTKGEHDIFAHQ